MKKYVLKCKKSLLLFIASNIVGAATAISLAFVLGFIAQIAIKQETDKIGIIALVAFIYIVIDAFFDFSSTYTTSVLVHNVSKYLRSDLVRKIESISYENKTSEENGYYLSKINNDIEIVDQEYIGSLCQIFFQICCLIFAISSTLIIQPVITVIILLLSSIPILFPKLTEKSLQKAKDGVIQQKATYMNVLDEIFHKFLTLKLFNGFTGINKIHDNENEKLKDSKLKYAKINRIVYSGAYGLSNMIYLATWVIGLVFVVHHALTLPKLIALSQLMTFVGGPIQIISERYSLYISAKAVSKDLVKFINSENKEESSWGDKILLDIESVELRNVNYINGEKHILKNINLSLHKKQKIAIIGESGSGKTTLLNVLAGLLTIEGSYLINDVNYHNYTLDSFRDEVVLQNQDNIIFNTDAKNNITVFNEYKTDEICNTIRTLGLEERLFVNNKLSTEILGKNNNKLSGGEVRRLELGRVILKHGNLVLLDEPTAGLDIDNRKFIENLITSMNNDIIVTTIHNYTPEFLEKFDLIIVMEKGMIKQQILHC